MVGGVYLARLAKENLLLENRRTKREGGHAKIWGGGVALPCQGTSKCKGPEVETCSRNGKARVTEARSTNACLKYQYDVEKAT